MSDSKEAHGQQVLSLRAYVDLVLQNKVLDVSSNEEKKNGTVSLHELRMSCTRESPSSRMPTGGIIKEVEVLAKKDSLMGEHRT